MRISISVLAAATLLPLAVQPAAAEAAASGTVTVVNQKTGRCLAVAEGTRAKGAHVIQWRCTGGAEQRWRISKRPGGIRLRNVASGQCLAIAYGTTKQGVKAIQWPCYRGKAPEQVWVRNAKGQLRNFDSRRCLAIANGTRKQGVKPIQWSCYQGNAPEQVWLFR